MIESIESDPRIALQVTRYHTWPHVQDQSVGEHSAQVMRILLTVWPHAPRRLLIHCLLHDVGEMAGDVPYPGKKNNPALKQAMDALEDEYHGQMTERWDLPGPVALPEYEERVFKLCEYVEMWEYGLQEQNLGNRYAAVIAMRMLLAASALLEWLVPPSGDYPDLRPAVRRYVERRREHENGGVERTKVIHIHEGDKK